MSKYLYYLYYFFLGMFAHRYTVIVSKFIIVVNNLDGDIPVNTVHVILY